MEHWTEYTRFLTALLVILNPFAALPIFLGLTDGYSDAERVRAVWTASLTVAVVLTVAALFGEQILLFLGTSLPSFRVGGGMVLLVMAFNMLHARHDPVRTTASEKQAAEERETVAVVPVAVPLLAGPGAISTVVIEMHRAEGALHLPAVLGVIGSACAVLWVVLRLALPIGTALGHIGLNIITRLFGLLLAAIAVEIMANGLRELFPVLG